MHHQYADDTNLYHSFSAKNQRNCIDLMTECLNSVNNWFLTNGLLVNPNKSDSMFVGTAAQLKKIVCDGIMMGGEVVPLSSSVKSLGVIIDEQLKLDSHVKNVCRICYFHIRGLRSLRSSLDDVTAVTIGRAIVMSRLDYCNSLLSHTSAKKTFTVFRWCKTIWHVWYLVPHFVIRYDLCWHDCTGCLQNRELIIS